MQSVLLEGIQERERERESKLEDLNTLVNRIMHAKTLAVRTRVVSSV